MGIIGKIVGGTIGFTLGGPLGAVAGAVFGHAFDSEPTAPSTVLDRRRGLAVKSVSENRSRNSP